MVFTIEKTGKTWRSLNLKKAEQDKLNEILNGLGSTNEQNPASYISQTLKYEVKTIKNYDAYGDAYQVDIGTKNRLFFRLNEGQQIQFLGIGHT